MSQSTTLTQKELFNTQLNVEETHKQNSSLIRRTHLEKTPFTLIEKEEGQNFITFGRHRLTQIHDTPEKAIDELETNFWEIIANLIIVLIEMREQELINEITKIKPKTAEEHEANII